MLLQRLPALAVVGVAVLSAAALATSAEPRDALQVFSPCLRLSPGDRARIDGGGTVTRTIDETGSYLGVFGVRRIDVSGDHLVDWIRHVDQLLSSNLVQGVKRFSDPPALSDLDTLSLDDGDVEALKDCRPNHCSLKLSADEIGDVPPRLKALGSGWKGAAQDAFRGLILRRVDAYRHVGDGGLAQYADGQSPRAPGDVFTALVERSPCLTDHAPALTAQLAGRAPSPPFESFLYWAKEHYAGKPVVSASEITIARGAAFGGDPQDAIVIGRQLFATHYINGSLNVTAIVSDADPSRRYLVIMNRSSVDIIHGLFGGVARAIVERRLRSELAQLLNRLATRLATTPKDSAQVNGWPN